MRFIQNILALCSAVSVLAAPTASLEERQTGLSGKNLKILPLGDSITVSISRNPTIQTAQPSS